MELLNDPLKCFRSCLQTESAGEISHYVSYDTKNKLYSVSHLNKASKTMNQFSELCTATTK